MLSVVMPVYNNALYVAQAIESVLAQTHHDFELLACDDGSSDASLEVLRQYERQDPRVRVLSHGNIGLCATMNEAIAQCRGEWIACMHGDDLMLPRRLERQLQFLAAAPDLSLTSCLAQWIDQRGRPMGYNRSNLTTREGVRSHIASGGVLAFPHPGAVFKRSVVQAVGGYRDVAFPTEDLDLWNRIADAGYGVLVQDEVLLKYRIHSTSSSTTLAKRVMHNLRWVEACTRARRAGLAEPTMEQFDAARRGLGWRARFGDYRVDLGHALYQRALARYAGRRYARMVPLFVAAAALRPRQFLPRIAARVPGLRRRQSRKLQPPMVEATPATASGAAPTIPAKSTLPMESAQ